nr:MAG TPA: hypothetical protein [Caudoviricetes sp.]
MLQKWIQKWLHKKKVGNTFQGCPRNYLKLFKLSVTSYVTLTTV